MRVLTGLAILMMLVVPRSWAQAPNPSEQELITLENDWSQAAVKRDGTALQRFYADEYIFTDEDGVISNKAKEMANITSGEFRLTSFKFEDLKVHLYSDVAVVTGQNTIKGMWAAINSDVSGPYRFTDVFVKRGGRWQCVASQSSRIAQK
jgi:ketosteroid isomerase-like protein